MRSTRRLLPRATRYCMDRVSGRSTAPATTPCSCAILTATTWRPSAPGAEGKAARPRGRVAAGPRPALGQPAGSSRIEPVVALAVITCGEDALRWTPIRMSPTVVLASTAYPTLPGTRSWTRPAEVVARTVVGGAE